MSVQRLAVCLIGFALTTVGLTSWGLAQGEPASAPADVPGMEVLTRGPVHEAFAEPIVYDPKAGPIIPKEPPPQVEELPPDQRPDGNNVQWIPGYWSWDDERNDYLWVSGIWRDVPPGRQWVPGYWSQVDGGYQWTAGAWVAADEGQLEYLPEPPQSLEVGPNGPSPSANASWAPGCWYWQETRYVWRPGYWVPFQPNWLWVPAHYIWTPNGYLYVDGYWDMPFATRGLAFAPVYFAQPVYAQPQFVYTPTVGLLAAALASSLFVRPAYQQYCFGDYFAASNFNSGIYPWYSYHQSRYGYDPLFSHYAAVHTRRDPRWIENLHDEYRFRRDHPDARPARTFVQQQTIVNNVTNIKNVNVTKVQNLVIGRSITQVAARGGGPAGKRGPDFNGLKFERIDEGRRKAIVQQTSQLREFRQQRIRQELELVRQRPQGPNQGKEQAKRASLPDRPRRVDFPRSPIAGMPLRDQPGRRDGGAGQAAREAAKAARQENAARQADNVRDARAAREAAKSAQQENAARRAEAARESLKSAREENAAREAAKAANAAQRAQAGREAAKAARQENAAREAARQQNAAQQAEAMREAAKAARQQNVAKEATRQQNAARQAEAARAARQQNAANEAMRQQNAAQQAEAAKAARQQQNAANEAMRQQNAARQAEAAKAARQQNAANEAMRQQNAARQAEAMREAAKAARQQQNAARIQQFRGANPPPQPVQPRPDLNRRPGQPNQFRQQRHEPDPNRLPPQFQGGRQFNGRMMPNRQEQAPQVRPQRPEALRQQRQQQRQQQQQEGPQRGQKRRDRD